MHDTPNHRIGSAFAAGLSHTRMASRGCPGFHGAHSEDALIASNALRIAAEARTSEA